MRINDLTTIKTQPKDGEERRKRAGRSNIQESEMIGFLNEIGAVKVW